MPKTQKKYCDKQWLYTRYSQQGVSIAAIAKECKVGFTTISRWLAEFEIRKIKSYNVDRKGSNAPFWKGGRYKDNYSGYIWVYSPQHPFRTKKGYVLEHRLVMEKFIGRYLRANEIIHHKNKIKHNNQINNLEIIILGEPNCGEILCPFCNKKFKVG